ncbi:type II toxin-antitoxin system RelE/ParE family toxin [Actinomadura keratinilytica]
MITHPVRVTPDALKDLLRLYRQDPQILRAALQKIRLLESNPYAGRPLLGDLASCRKLVVGDRTWRIVWRVLTDAEGNTSIEISEVLAIGSRENNRVYEEARKRLERMEPSEAARTWPTCSGVSAWTAPLRSLRPHHPRSRCPAGSASASSTRPDSRPTRWPP